MVVYFQLISTRHLLLLGLQYPYQTPLLSLQTVLFQDEDVTDLSHIHMGRYLINIRLKKEIADALSVELYCSSRNSVQKVVFFKRVVKMVMANYQHFLKSHKHYSAFFETERIVTSPEN